MYRLFFSGKFGKWMELIYHFPEKNDLQCRPQMSNLKVAALARHHAASPMVWIRFCSSARHWIQWEKSRCQKSCAFLEEPLTSKLWLVGGGQPYPSEKWWSESQLGWWHFPILWESHKKCSKPPIRWEYNGVMGVEGNILVRIYEIYNGMWGDMIGDSGV